MPFLYLLVLLFIGASQAKDMGMLDMIRSDPLVNACDGKNGTTCCHYNATSNCSLKELQYNQRTFVHPGGNTGCLHHKPYRFEVTKGKLNKVLLYFQGGGGCWSKFTATVLPLCKTRALHSEKLASSGVFNRHVDHNPYKDWTVVHVLYCSGDVGLGNSTMEYKDRLFEKYVQHKGINNVRSAMDWLENQNLVMDDFVVMSCSAGAVAVQAYANEIIRKFPAKRRAIVVDSYAGIAHDKVDAKLFKSYNLCESDIFDWSPALKAACFNQTLKVPDMLEASIKANPSVPFIFINSKADFVQRGMYWASSFSIKLVGKERYYGRLSQLLARYSKYPNFSYYLIDGSSHCFTNAKYFFTTYTTGFINPLHPLLSTTPNKPKGSIQSEIPKPISLVDFLQKIQRLGIQPSACAGEEIAFHRESTETNRLALNSCIQSRRLSQYS